MPTTPRVLGALSASAALLLGSMGLAAAESRTVRDRANPEDPAYGDIRQVRLDNTTEGLRVTTSLAEVRAGTYWVLTFHDDQGRPHRIIAVNRGARKNSWVRVQERVGGGYRPYECRGLTQAWNTRTDRITVFIPGGRRSCGGPAHEYFYLAVGPVDDRGVRGGYFDMVRSSESVPRG